uniref:PHD-type domain-containing protein n=1 Tax=Amphimedon queenslandica TaxID=400682 RepID=A0A1X7UI53_AMPQE
MPPKKPPKKKSKSYTCPICDDQIDDSTQQSIWCDGECNTWLHRGCAGLSKAAHSKLNGTDIPFYCPHCRLMRQDREIESLKASLSDLSKRFDDLTSKSPGVSTPPDATSVPSQPTRVVKNHSKPNSMENRKFNLVLSGIPEAPSSQSRSVRAHAMFEKVSEVFSEVLGDTNGPLPHIRDCRRLGKFQSPSDGFRPRSILVTLDSVLTVDRILSKVSSASHGAVKIRRDLPFEDRLAHSVLMKERWSMIQAGTDRSVIKLRKRSLLVDGQVHGSVINGSFVLAAQNSSPDLTSPAQTPSTTPVSAVDLQLPTNDTTNSSHPPVSTAS